MLSDFDLPDRGPDDLSRMREAAERAIQLDPLLAEAHAALGPSTRCTVGTVREVLSAISRDTRSNLAYIRRSAGRFEQSAAHCPARRERVARALLGQGRIEEAMRMSSEMPGKGSAAALHRYSAGWDL